MIKPNKVKWAVIAIIMLVAAGIPNAVIAGVPTVKAKLDSTTLLMGKLANLRLEVTQDKGKPGGFPLLSGQRPEGFVTVCGDSVELRTSYKRDTTEIGSGRIQINYDIPVQAFDSGFYQLPQFVYVSGTDTARSNSVSLKVVPVNVAADAKISDYAAPADPEGSKLTDYLPDWMVDFWWLILAVLIVIGLMIWGMRRYREKGFILPKKPEPLPYDVAVRDLKKLKALNLWEQGLEKEYFTRLTDILRVYLDKRFGINALEMTTQQIIEKLYENPAIKDKRDYIRRILDTADYVKFAKVRPMPEDNIAAYDSAWRFVEETKPTQEEIDAHKAKMAEAEEATGGKSNKTGALKMARKVKKIKRKGGRR